MIKQIGYIQPGLQELFAIPIIEDYPLKTIEFTIGFLPVIIDFTGGLELRAEAEAQAVFNITTEFSFYASIRFGFQYTEKDGFVNVYDYNSPQFKFKRPTFELPDDMTEAAIKLVLAPTVKATFWKLIPIQAELAPYIGSGLYFNDPLCKDNVAFYQLYTGIDFSISIEIIEFEFAGLSFKLDLGGLLPCMFITEKYLTKSNSFSFR